MKSLSFLLAAGLLLVLSTTQSTAQTAVAGDVMVTPLVDTSFTLVAEVTFMPGQKTDVHTHPAHFVYVLSGGELTVHFSSGKTEKIALKAGEYIFLPPESPHWTENTGKTPMKFLLIEYNDYPYMEMKDMKMKK
jgi:quercetin dioxygenase-like cupin family protein